jgi:citrate synthase
MAEVYEGALDKGLEGVVACSTGVSSIVDATLCYRGYTIEDLAANSTFEEVIYLLWNDKLPTSNELEEFKAGIAQSMQISQEYLAVLKTLPVDNVHPMAWLRTAVSLAAHFDPNARNSTPEARQQKAYRLTAVTPLLVGIYKRIREGQEPIAPVKDKSIAWNLVNSLTDAEPDAEVVSVMDTALILHADHELNCSAFASRVTASSLSDMYSAVVSAIGALKGPLHGGANEQVMIMLKDIGNVDGATKWVREALDNKQKIMGFGHRVYKNGDPRAKILRSMSESLTKKMGEPQWYEMSKVIDDTVQNEKGLLPNVDFYSATVYYSMGIPTDLYTPIFAASRVTGWLAHIFEQYANNRIYRPRGKWSGKTGLKYVPISER